MKLIVAIGLTYFLTSSASAFVPKSSGSQIRRVAPLNIASKDLKGYYTNYADRQIEDLIPSDRGFDPLGFSETEAGLFWMRESEIKHARLAMLAAAGWPIAELLDRPLANAFGADAVVDSASRSPSILNGGLDKVSPFYWAAILAVASVIDIYQINKANEADESYFPGKIGFDPLGLYPKDKEGQLKMQLAEIKNGRLAMIAITAFAFQEYVSNLGVVEETPVFFKPLFGLF